MATAAQRDKTAIVQKFLDSFEDVQHFRVGVFRRAQNWMKNFEPLTAADVVAMVPSLMAWNAEDKAEIYFTPIGEHAYVLIDDIDAGGVALLRRRGAWPAALVETSPGLHHVWLRLSREAVSAPVRRCIAKMLAREYGPYGADKGSASIDHYGRLPGFCNYKTERVDQATGKSPWVKLIQGTPGRPAPVGAQWVAAASSALGAEAARMSATEERLPSKRARLATSTIAGTRRIKQVPKDAYQNLVVVMESMMEFLRDGSGPDGSRIDWRACISLL